jgi:hypothetical protein
MNYINFVVITDTPGRLATFLVSRNIIQQVPDDSGGQQYVGVLPGMEWVKVPNPIVTDPGPPPVYDTRHVFLVKFAHDSVENQVDVDSDTTQNAFDWSKFGRWVKANSTVVTAPANYTINGQPAGDAYKITGQNVWLVRDGPERFGVWQ